MLHSLSIKNYALIDKVEIKFSNGLSIITGETGAGKSIILGALSLILGQRADTSVLLNKEDKCIIEGTFHIKQYGLESFFAENLPEVDYQEETIIRRQINAGGVSRVFINDSPVNLSELKLFGTKLVDIHSQHANLMLADNIFQIKVVDIFAAHNEILSEYKAIYAEFKKTSKEYTELNENSQKAKADLDYFQHRFDKLYAANLRADEQEELEKELETLTHAEEITTSLNHIHQAINGDNDSNILNNLKEIMGGANKIQQYFSPAKLLSERLDSVYIELKDIAQDAENHGFDIEFDPARIEFINQRLNTIYNLQQVHRVSTVAELIDIKNHLQQQIDEITSIDFKLDEKKKLLSQLKLKTHELASKLSVNRKKALPSIEKEITEILKQLGMPNAVFSIDLKTSTEYTEWGSDKINFLFSANKSVEKQDLTKVASGGELSRVMLALKSVMCKSIALPTIVFDEIDAGVSGDIANKMGNIIYLMSRDMQVINITHLPQVASKGENHFLVYKTHDQNTTSTHIKLLDKNERMHEIAKMLSGENITEAALNNAKELLNL